MGSLICENSNARNKTRSEKYQLLRRKLVIRSINKHKKIGILVTTQMIPGQKPSTSSLLLLSICSLLKPNAQLNCVASWPFFCDFVFCKKPASLRSQIAAACYASYLICIYSLLNESPNNKTGSAPVLKLLIEVIRNLSVCVKTPDLNFNVTIWFPSPAQL
jgi:hypothetical protein